MRRIALFIYKDIEKSKTFKVIFNFLYHIIVIGQNNYFDHSNLHLMSDLLNPHFALLFFDVMKNITFVVLKFVLFFVVSQMFFMSGPVVVSPSETITFQSCQYNQDLSNIKWWMIKDHSIKEIKPDNTKYLYQKKDNIKRFEITIAEKDDSATYQFSLNNMRSNKISVHVDGKYIHQC